MTNIIIELLAKLKFITNLAYWLMIALSFCAYIFMNISSVIPFFIFALVNCIISDSIPTKSEMIALSKNKDK